MQDTSGGQLVQPLLLKCHVQATSEYPQGWRLHSLFGQPVLVLSHPRNEEEFSGVQMEPAVFQHVPIASGPVTGHCRAEPGSVLFSLVYTLMTPL